MINDKFATDAKTHANLFKSFFLEQCTLLKNDFPKEPMFPNTIKTAFNRFQSWWNTKIIRSFDVNKTYGHDDILKER